MPDQVGFPVESLGTLVTLVLPLLGVDHHVLLQAAEETRAESRSGTQRGDRDGDREPAVGPGGFPVTCCLRAGRDSSTVRRAVTPKQHLRFFQAFEVYFTGGRCPVLPQNDAVFYVISY